MDEPTPENVARTIERLAALEPREYEAMCRHAEAGAKEYDFKNLTKKLIDVIEGV